MACLTIWVSPIHSEPNIIVLKLAIAFERDAPRARVIFAINAGSEEWVSTLGAEKVLFVICALSELRIVQSYKTLVHNGCLAMIAPWCETLMIIEMAVRFAIAFIRANVLEQIITVTTPEAARVPPDTHCTDNASDDRTTTTTARKATPTTRG